MSSYETERSTRRPRMSSTMDSTQQSAIDIDPCHHHQKQKKTDSNCFCYTATALVVVLFIALLAGGAILLYRSKDNVQKKILILVQETNIWLEHGNGTTSRIVKALLHPIFVLYHDYTRNRTGEEYMTSYDRGYLEAALHLKKSINESVDPCEDFSEFSCGVSNAEYPIPDDKTSTTTLSRLAVKVEDQIQKLFASTGKSTSKAIEKLRQFYSTCLDYNQYGAEAIKRTQEVMKEIGSFPMLDGSDPSPSTSFVSLVMQIARLDFGIGVISIGLERDLKDHDRRLIKFDEGGMPLSREDWLTPTEKSSSEKIEAFRTLIRRRLEEFAKDTGLSGVSPSMEKDVDDLFALYTRLAEVFRPEADKLDVEAQYNIFDFVGLVERFEKETGLNLRDWLIEAYPKHNNDLLKDPKIQVAISFPDFVGKIISVIRETSAKTWLNYYQFHAFDRYGSLFPEKYRDIDQDFKRVTSGQTVKNPRQQECLLKSKRSLQDAFGAFYVRKHFSAETRQSLADMIANVKEAFEEIVTEADWMDEKTRSRALAKSKNILEKIGHEDMAYDDALLDQYHEDLRFRDSMGMAELSDEIRRWRNEKNWEKFLAPYDRTSFEEQSAEVNAFYSPSDNSIIFPAATLQEPIFKSSWPKALTYAGMGMIVGHEITHGFDSQGRTFDENGHLNMWWTNETARRFKEKAQCIEDQYSKFEEETTKMKVNGKLSLGENIADNGGIREAYRAYQKLIQKQGQKEHRLPGYDYTPEQLFFIGYAQTWCGSVRPAVLRHNLQIDTHSPYKARINVVVSNQPEFAEAFKCSAGAPMNPEKKCKVW